MLLQQHCLAHGPSPPRLCLCPACAARTIAATGVGPWGSRGALVGAGSPARAVQLRPTGRALGAAPSPLLPLHTPERAEGRRAAGGAMTPSWPLQQDTRWQQPCPESRSKVLPQNWGKDWGWTGLRAGW